MNRAPRRAAERRHRKHPSRYEASELVAMLVDDALTGHPTDLRWAVTAYQVIGAKTGNGPEWAFAQVSGQVHARGGFMPDGEAGMAGGRVLS